MKYCGHCTHELSFEVPPDDDRPRHCCRKCGAVFYDNPKVIVGCLPRWENQVLLCRRAIEPRRGYWTLPAGFMELGETVEEGAARETFEEARANVSIVGLHSVVSLPYISQVYMIFLADLVDLNFAAGPESLEVRLFTEADVPHDEIAFRTVKFALERFYSSPPSATLVPHFGTFERRPDDSGASSRDQG